MLLGNYVLDGDNFAIFLANKTNLIPCFLRLVSGNTYGAALKHIIYAVNMLLGKKVLSEDGYKQVVNTLLSLLKFD